METRQIIAHLGGPRKAAALLGVSRQAINQWPHTGIPYRHWPALQARGVPLRSLEESRKVALTASPPDAPRHAAAEVGA